MLARIRAAPIVHISAAAIWELTIKAMLGKIDLPDDFEQQLWEFGFEPLTVTPAHAAGITSFPEIEAEDGVYVLEEHDGVRYVFVET